MVTGNSLWSGGFAYDLAGNVRRSTDANGTSVFSEYDRANRVVRRCYTLPGAAIPVGALPSCASIKANPSLYDPNTPEVEYFYDGKGMDGSAAPRNGSVDARYSKGKLTKVTSNHSETRYTQFDHLGRLVQMEQRTKTVAETIQGATPQISSYEYNFAGALVKETYPSGRVVQNDFDVDGDLSRIYGKATPTANERTYATGFSYTPDGRIQRLRLGNGRWESAKFNERLQVTEFALGVSNGDGSLWKVNYEYGELDANGSVNAENNTGNIAMQTISFNGLPSPIVQTYRYDSLYRLKEARETPINADQSWKQRFNYDRFGNRNFDEANTTTIPRKCKDPLNSTIDVVCDADRKLLNPTIDPLTNRFIAGQGYTFDKNGNLITDADGMLFVFNGDNKQRLVTKNSQNVGEYFYDGEGKRVRKVEWDGTVIKSETIFVYSAGKLVEEYSTEPVTPNPTTGSMQNAECKLQNVGRCAVRGVYLTPISMRAVG